MHCPKASRCQCLGKVLFTLASSISLGYVCMGKIYILGSLSFYFLSMELPIKIISMKYEMLLIHFEGQTSDYILGTSLQVTQYGGCSVHIQDESKPLSLFIPAREILKGLFMLCATSV